MPVGETSRWRWQAMQEIRSDALPTILVWLVRAPKPSIMATCSPCWPAWQAEQSAAACATNWGSRTCLISVWHARQSDLVIGDVRLVHEHMVVDAFEVVFAIVAHAAAFARHLALAANQVGVTVDAVDALLDRQVVAELGAAAQFEFLVRDLVAARASAQSFVELARP